MSETKARVDDDDDAWGYDLYPERRGGSPKAGTFFQSYILGEGRSPVDKLKCEERVVNAMKSSPLVRLMMDSLKSSGCPFDVARHISCETCDGSVTGGYDPKTNQIVVCQNSCKMEGLVTGVLVHEMIHMFDYCVNKLDFRNLRHLACTEIRAANLTHCSYLSAFFEGSIPKFKVREQHALCVKQKAFNSILNVRRGVTEGDAVRAVEAVFDRCYNDLEPIGRRIRRGTKDVELVCEEGFLMGYS